MVYKFFDKKTELGISVNEQLAEKLHKPVIKKLKTNKQIKSKQTKKKRKLLCNI